MRLTYDPSLLRKRLAMAKSAPSQDEQYIAALKRLIAEDERNGLTLPPRGPSQPLLVRPDAQRRRIAAELIAKLAQLDGMDPSNLTEWAREMRLQQISDYRAELSLLS